MAFNLAKISANFNGTSSGTGATGLSASAFTGNDNSGETLVSRQLVSGIQRIGLPGGFQGDTQL